MRGCIGICLALCLVLGAIEVDADNKGSGINTKAQLTFVTHRPMEVPINQWLINVYTEAFKRLGYDLTVIHYPSKRASQYSNAGQVDGELSRVYDYDTKYPNLLRVEEHNYIVRFSAFSLDKNIDLTGWESLRNSDYRICYRRGGKKVTEQLFQYVAPTQLFEIQSLEQAAHMLFSGRADLLITFDSPMKSYLSSQEFLNIKTSDAVEESIHHVGVMQEMTGHAWLHKDHQMLVPQLENTLKVMKEEKLFEKYRNDVGLTSAELEW